MPTTLTNHERAINEFIPEARQFADAKIRESGIGSETRKNKDKGDPYTHCFWTEHFHKEMNRLTIKAGLRNIQEEQ